MPRDIIGKRLRVGVNPQVNTATVRTSIALINHEDPTNPDNLSLGQFSNDANGASLLNVKSRGSVAAPANVALNDRLSDYAALAMSGGLLFDIARFRAYVDAAVVNGQAPASRWEWETAVGNAAPAVRMILNRLGALALGGAAPAVAGDNYGGIQVGAGSPVSGIYPGNASNLAANVLDYYHESTAGEYVPALTFGGSGAGITYGGRFGWYTRIGNRVFVNFSMTLTNKGAAAGVAEISLPVAYDNAREIAAGGLVTLFLNMAALTSQVGLRTNGAATTLMRFNMAGAANTVDLSNVNFTNTSILYGYMMYDAVS